ncbi:MAG: chromosomal replication initiator protein DnaA [Victivallaceae bacterium]|jgi:chromosomal replication initiator protein
MRQHDKCGLLLTWTKTCELLKKRLHQATYEQWFGSIVPVRLDGEQIVLGVSDDFFADWLKENFGDILTDALSESAGHKIAFTLETGHVNVDEIKASAEIDAEAEAASPAEDFSKNRAKSSGLAKHTFGNFVVGEENRYAYAAAKTAADTPGVYNPLYIYGGTGIGKTHLLQAVANQVLEKNSKAVVKYVTCEEFLNNYVDSLRSKRHSEFRSSVRKVDVILVDDVHMLANKTQLQEEFFNTFNSLYNENKQIILTSDKQPCEIVGLEDRLVSRFESGVTTEISAPVFETRLAILRMMQESHLIKIEDEVLVFLANRISSSVRRLKGALLRLVAFASAMSNRRITIEDAESLLHKVIEEESASKIISIYSIQKAVADHFDIRVNDILSEKRPKNIAEPRMVAMYLCRKMTNHSFPEIGAAFGKNHATIMNANKKIPELCERNESMKRSLSLIQRQLQQS